MARIGIDYTAAVQQGAGIGRYVRELVASLLRLETPESFQYRLFAASSTPLPALPFRVTRLPFHDRWLVRVWHRARIPLPVELITGPIDLYHSPDFTLPPTLSRTKTLLTVHDLSFVRDPDSADDRLRAFLSTAVPRSVARADHVLADSQATKDDLMELWATPSEKITVLYCGVDARFRPIGDPEALAAVRARYGLGKRPFFLSVSTLQPRKNYRRLMQAFAPLAESDRDLMLVIGGGKGWRTEEILAEPARLGIGDSVVFPGFIDDDDLPALYSAAIALAYPSLYEGFGLPVLEAMACGTPVITSDRSSLPEVTADAGLQIDPLDVDAWTAGLTAIVEDTALREILIARGLAQAKRFNWERAAGELLSIYRRLLQQPGSPVRVD
jgi:glycosyltransferase involved in cell wall biosynthesis